MQWSIEMLVQAGCSTIVVVVPPDTLRETSGLLEQDRVVVVEGGPTRRASVMEGLRVVAVSRVVINDAARPLATPEMARRAVDALATHDGAVTAIAVTDTLKRVEEGSVRGTVEREGLYRAQTPQAFRTEILQAAHSKAAEEGFEPTDDAVLLEHYGGSVAVVEGAETNIKVTYEKDFAAAEALLRAR